MFISLLAAAFALSSVALADPIPTGPDSSSVFNQGSTCTIEWTADPTGIWKNMSIELMTGDNFHMIHLSTIVTLDGTDQSKSPFSYPCLKVTPNSAIYFYQFTSPFAPNTTWTTRFTLAGPNGETTPPTNATQPGGAAIAWGTGALQNPADGTPPPAKAGSAIGSSSSSDSNSTTTGSASQGTQSTTPSITPTPLSASNTNTATTSGTSTSNTASPSNTTSTTSNGITLAAGNLAILSPLVWLLSSL